MSAVPGRAPRSAQLSLSYQSTHEPLYPLERTGQHAAPLLARLRFHAADEDHVSAPPPPHTSSHSGAARGGAAGCRRTKRPRPTDRCRWTRSRLRAPRGLGELRRLCASEGEGPNSGWGRPGPARGWAPTTRSLTERCAARGGSHWTSRSRRGWPIGTPPVVPLVACRMGGSSLLPCRAMPTGKTRWPQVAEPVPQR